MAPPRPKNRFSKENIIIYGIITIIIAFICAFVGGAMDFSLTTDGSVDIEKMGNGFNTVVNDVSYIFKNLFKPDSYVCKMLFLGVSGMGIFILYKYSEDPKKLHRRGVEHGSAKWGNEKEMKSLAEIEKKPEFKPVLRNGQRIFDKKGNFVGFTIDNNIILTKEVHLSLNSRQHLLNHNVLIIGGSGAGKTRFYAKPNIMQLNTSFVVTDPKGEILADTGKMLIEAGYKVRVFNTIEMEHSNNYNPFEYVYDTAGNLSEDNVLKMIDVLFDSTKGDGEKEDFWSQKGKSMLEAIILLLFEESAYNMEKDENGNLIPETRDKTHLNFFSATEKMRKLQYPGKGRKDGFFLQREDDEDDETYEERRNKAFLCPLDKDFIELEKRNPDSLALRLYKEVRNAPEETGQSFLSSANVKTFMFNMEHLSNLTCCDNINLDTLGDEKTAVFIIISATNSTYNFLAAMMYTQLFDTLANIANFKYGGTLKVPVRFIMDEFANIGQIPDFDKVIAFVRSMGMSLNVIIQNMAQLKAKYEKTWEVITGNCDSLLFLGGKEESTLKSISETLGKETIDIHGYNRTKGKTPSMSENNQSLGRELMQVNELSTMPISDCVLIIRSHNPFYCKKYPLEKHPNYAFLADAAKGKNEKEERTFKVSSIHAISIADLKKEREAEKVIDDTNSNSTISVDTSINTESELDLISEIVSIDTSNISVSEIDIIKLFNDNPMKNYGDEILSADEIEYEKVNMSFDSFDFGTATRKEDITYATDTSALNVNENINEEVDIVQYGIPEPKPESYGDISSELIEEVVLTTSEIDSDVFEDVEFDDFDKFYG